MDHGLSLPRSGCCGLTHPSSPGVGDAGRAVDRLGKQASSASSRPTAGGQPVPGSRVPVHGRAGQAHAGLSLPAFPGGPPGPAGQVRQCRPYETPGTRGLLCAHMTHPPFLRQEPCLFHSVPHPQPGKGELPSPLPRPAPGPRAFPSTCPALLSSSPWPPTASHWLCSMATASGPL